MNPPPGTFHSCSDEDPNTAPYAEAFGTPKMRRSARAGTFAALFSTGVIGALAGCQGAPEPGSMPVDGDSLGSVEQELTPSDIARLTGSGLRQVTPIVSRVFAFGRRTIGGVVDVAKIVDVDVDIVPSIALSGVRTCRDQVTECLDGVVDDLDVGACAEDLEQCVDGVVAIIDPALDPLPGPSPSGILTGTDACRADAKNCLIGALNLNDVRACGDLLGTCVDDATAIIDDTVDDVNDILDPLTVPTPSVVVDCALQLTECLAKLGDPFDCAEQAQICATP
jgi:hypothetical protein